MTAPRCRARSSIRSSTREEQAREVQDAYTAEECSGTARSLWICDIATTTKPVYSVNVSCCISLTKNTEAEGAIFLSIRYLDLQVYSLQSFTYHRATGRNTCLSFGPKPNQKRLFSPSRPILGALGAPFGANFDPQKNPIKSVFQPKLFSLKPQRNSCYSYPPTCLL